MSCYIQHSGLDLGKKAEDPKSKRKEEKNNNKS
jgi:hypothetical protein